MNTKSKYLFNFIIVSLLALVGLQFYYGVLVFKQNTQDLQEDLERVTLLTVKKIHNKRINSINALFAKDLKSGKYAKLSLINYQGEPHIVIKDAISNLKILSIRYEGSISDTISNTTLQNIVIERNKSHLNEGEIMYWTEELGNKLTRYRDSITLNANYIEKEISTILANEGISNPFGFKILTAVAEGKVDWPSKIYSSAKPIPLLENQYLQVYLNHPSGIIIKRIGLLLVISLLVLSLVLIGFFVLLSILKKQRKLGELKDDFISNVTHEMLTPMSSQRLAIDRLKKSDEFKSNTMLQIIDQQTKRFEEIINETLQTIIDDDTNTKQLENISPKLLIDEVVTYQQSITNKPVDFSNTIAKDLYIKTEQKHIVKVLHNLVNNAIIYNDSDVIKLSFSYSSDANYHYISITDNGIGISKSDKSLVFEKFHRINKETTYREKGLGIGLYQSKKLVRQLKGDLVLSKTSNTGSTFVIQFLKNNKDA